METLESALREIKRRYHHKSYLNSDPISFVHLYQDPWDQEAVAVVAALLAYGKVSQIRHSIRSLLTLMERMSQSPAYFVRGLQNPVFAKKAQRQMTKLYHRFNSGEDLFQLLKLISNLWESDGSVGGYFTKFIRAKDMTIESGLNHAIIELKKRTKGSVSPSFNFFLNQPSDGSCCKRWCMLFRWMGRRDAIDLGLWTQSGPFHRVMNWASSVEPRQLMMPVDTHIGRLSRLIGLTQRKTMNWQATVQITQAMRQISEHDPVEFDFSLCRLGITSFCQNRFVHQICSSCELQPVCVLGSNSSSQTLPMKGGSDLSLSTGTQISYTPAKETT